MSNLNRFRSKLAEGRDLAKANRFMVTFNVPQGVRNSRTYGPDLTYLCESTELPGRAFNTQEYRYYGPNFKMPHQSAYTDINFTLYVRSFMRDKILFDDWLEFINPKTTYDFKFRTEYSTNVNIWQFEESGSGLTPSYVATLRKAYPINVNAMPVAWAEDNIHRLQVTFCYVDWRKVGDPQATGTSTIDNLFDSLVRQAKQAASPRGQDINQNRISNPPQ